MNLRLFALLFSATLFLFGEGPAWTAYDQALAKGVETGKPVLLEVTSENCQYCRFMNENVLPDPEVAAFINGRYIPSRLYRGKDDLPHKVRMTPTYFLIDAASGKVLKTIPGGWKKEEFLDLITLKEE